MQRIASCDLGTLGIPKKASQESWMVSLNGGELRYHIPSYFILFLIFDGFGAGQRSLRRCCSPRYLAFGLGMQGILWISVDVILYNHMCIINSILYIHIIHIVHI